MGEIGRTVSREELEQRMTFSKDPKGEQVVNDPKEEVEKKETEKVDKKVDDKVDEKVVDKVDEKVDKKVDEPAKPEKSEVDLVSILNKDLERDFKDKDEIKALFDKAGKYDELQTSSDELKQKLAEYQKIAEGVDPLKYFANEDEYIRQQFLMNNKDKLSPESIDLLSGLSPAKVKKMSDLDAVKTSLMVDKGLSENQANLFMRDKYGVEDFNEELDDAAVAKIKVDAHDAKKNLSDLYNGINIPEKVDWETARTQLKQSWKKPLSETLKSLDKIELSEDISFVVEDDMKKGIEEAVMSELVLNGIKPSEEALGAIIGSVKDKILLNNMDTVMKSVESDLREKIKSELRTEVHNDKPVNNDNRGETIATKTADQAVLDAFGK